jgi:Lipid A core - O-antigen ligase and related enzymes
MNVNLKIVTFLLSLAMMVFAIVLGVSIGSGDILLPSLVAGFFVALALISRPQVAAFCAIATFSTGLTVPGLPGQTRLFDAFAVSLIGIFLLQLFMKRAKSPRLTRMEWIVLGFAVWIFFIGAYRGFGFLLLGGDMVGGFFYLKLLLSAALVIILPRIGLPRRAWKPVFILMALLAPITLFADLLVVKGWDFGVVRLFVQTSGDLSVMLRDAAGDDSTTVGRLFAAGPAANAMLLSLLCLVPMKKFFRFTGIGWLGVFAAIVALSLLSGYRLMTASLILIAALTLFLQKGFTTPRLALLFLAGCIGLFFVYFFASELPNSVQRAISWLPGIDVSNVAQSDAFQTVEWRLRLWRVALEYLPDYWLVGKGFSYNLAEALAAREMIYRDDLQWALVMSGYHNGWLSMILTTGLLGTIFCLVLLIVPVREHWKIHNRPWNSEVLHRYHGVFLAAITANAAIFVIVYGDVHVTFPVLFFQWAILKTLVEADAESAPEIEGEGVMESDYAESTYQG